MLLATSAYSQSVQTTISTCQEFRNVNIISQPDSFTITEAEQLSDKILEKLGLSRSFEVLASTWTNNAAAVILRKSGDRLIGRRYILYNPNWVSLEISKSRWVVIGLLSHEIGHHLEGHTLDCTGSTPAKELEADYFAGTVLKKFGATESQAIELWKNFPVQGTATHPPAEKRIAAVLNGWRAPISESTSKGILEDVRVLYFEKAADQGIVENILSQNNVTYERHTGFNNTGTNLITCSSDIPFSDVRSLATQLIEAGIEIKKIIKPDPSYSQTKRLSLESFTSLEDERPLTVSDLRKMQQCGNRTRSSPPEFPSYEISIHNRCSGSEADVWVRFKTTTGIWRMWEARSIPYGRSRRVQDPNGYIYRTNERSYYLYLEVFYNDQVVEWTDRYGKNRFQISDGRRPSFFRTTEMQYIIEC